MKTITWLFFYILTPSKSDQMRIDWNWFWRVEVPAWWGDLAIVKAAQQCVHWTRATLRRNEEPSDDDIPF